ncbi:MAG: ABC transporter permease [Saprospiraceae bacterium]|nr:ABC transporter permease [Saprospiraceae bacterium]
MKWIDVDKWDEIFNSIRKHKLRTALTALGVFWGIFMLVILLGAGQGLQNGVEYQFRDDATNSIWVRRGTTSKPFQGLPEGRQIRFTNEDYEYLRDNFEGIEHLTGRFYLSGDRIVTYGDKNMSFSVRAVHPGHRYLENTIMVSGRYLNQTDLDESRKVAVIGLNVRESLFGEEDPIGKEIDVGGIVYQIVGLYRDTGGESEMRIIYLPMTTAQKVYAGNKEIHQLMFTAGDLSVPQMKELESEVRTALARRHRFASDDRKALSMSNIAEEYQKFQNLFFAIRAFVWFVGVGTLFAGIIGVSNIMLIVVKDRTREIGVRKALGATPRSIVTMILQEAVFITGLAGYLGLLAGIGILSLLGSMEVAYFRNPGVHLGVAASAVLVLVGAGVLGGLMPAIQAARINPVEAMRSE